MGLLTLWGIQRFAEGSVPDLQSLVGHWVLIGLTSFNPLGDFAPFTTCPDPLIALIAFMPLTSRLPSVLS